MPVNPAHIFEAGAQDLGAAIAKKSKTYFHGDPLAPGHTTLALSKNDGNDIAKTVSVFTDIFKFWKDGWKERVLNLFRHGEVKTNAELGIKPHTAPEPPAPEVKADAPEAPTLAEPEKKTNTRDILNRVEREIDPKDLSFEAQAARAIQDTLTARNETVKDVADLIQEGQKDSMPREHAEMLARKLIVAIEDCRITGGKDAKYMEGIEGDPKKILTFLGANVRKGTISNPEAASAIELLGKPGQQVDNIEDILKTAVSGYNRESSRVVELAAKRGGLTIGEKAAIDKVIETVMRRKKSLSNPDRLQTLLGEFFHNHYLVNPRTNQTARLAVLSDAQKADARRAADKAKAALAKEFQVDTNTLTSSVDKRIDFLSSKTKYGKEKPEWDSTMQTELEGEIDKYADDAAYELSGMIKAFDPADKLGDKEGARKRMTEQLAIIAKTTLKHSEAETTREKDTLQKTIDAARTRLVRELRDLKIAQASGSGNKAITADQHAEAIIQEILEGKTVKGMGGAPDTQVVNVLGAGYKEGPMLTRANTEKEAILDRVNDDADAVQDAIRLQVAQLERDNRVFITRQPNQGYGIHHVFDDSKVADQFFKDLADVVDGKSKIKIKFNPPAKAGELGSYEVDHSKIAKEEYLQASEDFVGILNDILKYTGHKHDAYNSIIAGRKTKIEEDMFPKP